MIYFSQAEGTDLVKIGFTAGEPLKRLRELQTGCPHRLVLLAAVEGGEQDEGNWHKEFATDRVNGEWFKSSWRLMLAIARAEVQEGGATARPRPPLKGEDVVAMVFACPVCRDPKNETADPCPDCNGTGFLSRRQSVQAAWDAPVAMICEKRHHDGEPDITYPGLFCNVCGERIQLARDGNAFWMPSWTEKTLYAERYQVAFAHKACSRLVSGSACSQPLEAFVAYLGRNMGMKVPSSVADFAGSG
jgi:hypothetical protein